MASTFRFASLNCDSTVTVHKSPAPAYGHAEYTFSPEKTGVVSTLFYILSWCLNLVSLQVFLGIRFCFYIKQTSNPNIFLCFSIKQTRNPRIFFCFFIKQTFFMSICFKTVQALWFITNIPGFDLSTFPIIYCYK